MKDRAMDYTAPMPRARARAQHVSRLQRYNKQLKIVIALNVVFACAIGLSFYRDWSWAIRVPLILFALTVFFDISAVRTKLREQEQKIREIDADSHDNGTAG
jgi:hypothetical protein